MGWLVTRHALPADGAASIWSIRDHHASGRFKPVCPIARFSETSDSPDLDSSLCCKRRLKLSSASLETGTDSSNPFRSANES